MVSKNNLHNKLVTNAKHVPHYGLRKLTVGVASVLLGTTLYGGGIVAHAAGPVENSTDTPTNQVTSQNNAGTTVTLHSNPTPSAKQDEQSDPTLTYVYKDANGQPVPGMGTYTKNGNTGTTVTLPKLTDGWTTSEN